MPPPVSTHVLVAIGDTHATDGHRLSGETLAAVRAADVVVHTGDFTQPAVLDALEAEADRLVAVAGNNDGPGIRERVPETATVDALDRRFTVTHGHQQDDTARSLLARQEEADVLVVGHSHRPEIRRLGDVVEVNPGSYADPRWNEPAFAVVERETGALRARLVRPDGQEIDRGRL
jgi:putative phosphoesterase